MKYLSLALLGMLLMGMMLSAGICGGFLAGRWWGEWELHYLMDIPQGGMVLSPRTGSSWLKLDANTLRFMRFPDPRQATVTRLFSPSEKKEEKKNEQAADTGPAAGKPAAPTAKK